MLLKPKWYAFDLFVSRFLFRKTTAPLLGPRLPPRFGGRVGKMAAALSSLRRHVQRGLPGKTSHGNFTWCAWHAYDIAHIARLCSILSQFFRSPHINIIQYIYMHSYAVFKAQPALNILCKTLSWYSALHQSWMKPIHGPRAWWTCVPSTYDT